MLGVSRIRDDINSVKELIKQIEDGLKSSNLDEDARAYIIYNLKDCAWSVMRVEALLVESSR